jgi:glycosyltransferase involved in cell wall biosynthesis
MTLNHPKITIITVVCNAAEELKKTITSISSQDYHPLEFILIDGGSTDGTVDVIKANAGKITWWVSEHDGGIYDAMNKGLHHATGEWVNFMNAGDTFATPDTVSRVMETDLEGYGVVYGDSIAAYPHSQVFKQAGVPEDMVKGMVFCHQAAFIRRALIGEPGFDLAFPIGADFKIFFGLFTSGCRFKKLPYSVAVFDTTGTSNLKMVQSAREHFAIVKMYGNPGVSGWFYHVGFICWVCMVSFGYRMLPGRLVKWIQEMVNRGDSN